MVQRILVTGGSGFIGSHLVERLVQRGFCVTIADRVPPTCAPPDCRTFVGDIADCEFVHGVFSVAYDYVVHLAALAGVRPSLENSCEYVRTNVLGTANVLDFCRRLGVGRFIFASSSSVYGATGTLPFSESDKCHAPLNPYAASKMNGELLCHSYSHCWNLDAVCLRFFTVYGPRQRADLAIHKFARLLQKGEPVTVYGDGQSMRDYTYVDDIVDGIVAAMFKAPRGYSVYNLGSGRPASLMQMISLLEKSFGVAGDLKFEPWNSADMPSTFADISKAREQLAYEPKTSLAAGFLEFARWFANNS